MGMKLDMKLAVLLGAHTLLSKMIKRGLAA
jgi:hypothetical protein